MAAEEAIDDAPVATATGSAEATDSGTLPPAPDDEGFVWPEGAAAQSENAGSETDDAVAEEQPLPGLDELTKRIPPSVVETLDDLFRARFVSVKRVSPKSLKGL